MKKAYMRRPRILACIALAAAASLSACAEARLPFPSTPAVAAKAPDAPMQRLPAAMFLDHGFMANPMSDAAIERVVRWLKRRGFTEQFQNVTALRSDGTMNPANYAQLAHWIRVSRATDPHQKIAIYVSGSLNLVDRPATWKNIAALCKRFVNVYGADGVNLDFEPYRPQPSNYARLFETIRHAVGPSAQLSLDYTADPRAVWPGAAFRAISANFQWIAPMLYDTSCKTAACYASAVERAASYEYRNRARTASIVPIVPTYAASAYHRPPIENICTATDALNRSIAAKRLAPGGVAVWWYFGWNAAAERDWQHCRLAAGA